LAKILISFVCEISPRHSLLKLNATMYFIKLCNWHTDYTDSHGFLIYELAKRMRICVKFVKSVSSVCHYIQLEISCQ